MLSGMRSVALRDSFSFIKLEVRALLREPVSLFFMIFLPLILTVVFGGAFGSEETKYGAKVLGIDTIVPINVVFLLANTGLMGIPITILEIKEQGVLKRYITYPIQYQVYFSALLATFLLVCIASVMLFGSIAFIFYGASFFMSVAQVLIWILLFALTAYIFFGIGFLIALLIKSSRTANILSASLFMAMLFTSGVVMPLGSEPIYVQKVASLLPMSHAVEAMQMLWIGKTGAPDFTNNAIYLLVAGLIVTAMLSVVKINWDR